jgi:hypothetical protein
MASRPQHLAELAGSLEEMTSATRLRAYPSNHNEVPAIPTCTARQEREGVGAAAEFQKLLEHPGIVLSFHGYAICIGIAFERCIRSIKFCRVRLPDSTDAAN